MFYYLDKSIKIINIDQMIISLNIGTKIIIIFNDPSFSLVGNITLLF